MLLIHKSQSTKKLFFLVITSICGVGAFLGFFALTYTPELSHAETVTSKKTLADIEYMQDVTADICTNTPEADTAGNYQYQLKDSRDQKIYWVAKLKDGNCWMTQNLDLDIPAEGLKAEDTDIPVDWNSSSSNSPKATQITAEPSGFGGNNAMASWDPALGKADKYCGNNSNDACNLTKSGNNGHDHQGNYYSWAAATAGQAAKLTSTVTGEQSTQSICPKGWTLPTSGSDGKQYPTLLNEFSVAQITTSPYYFVRGGIISAGFLSAGSSGYYWSSTAYTYNSAFILSLSTDISFKNHWGRYAGMSVRCVSSGGEEQNYDNIEIMVNPQLSLDVANEVVVEKTETNPSTATLDAKVSSNMPYIISISSNNPDLSSSTSSTTIPATSGLLNTAVNGWGIKKYNTAGAEESTYTVITKDLQTFYTASGAEIKTIPFTIGISTAPDIPNGEYFTNITVTATQN